MAADHALFPGSFDPWTRGHQDVLRRALGLFERVTVAVGEHHAKQPLMERGERMALIERSVAGLDGVAVVALDGLLVDGCRALLAGVVVRGLRGSSDLEAETAMALTNRVLDPELETVFVLPAPEYAHVSSTLVRQIARLGGDVSALVPGPVAEALRQRFPRNTP